MICEVPSVSLVLLLDNTFHGRSRKISLKSEVAEVGSRKSEPGSRNSDLGDRKLLISNSRVAVLHIIKHK